MYMEISQSKFRHEYKHKMDIHSSIETQNVTKQANLGNEIHKASIF